LLAFTGPFASIVYAADDPETLPEATPSESTTEVITSSIDTVDLVPEKETSDPVAEEEAEAETEKETGDTITTDLAESSEAENPEAKTPHVEPATDTPVETQTTQITDSSLEDEISEDVVSKNPLPIDSQEAVPAEVDLSDAEKSEATSIESTSNESEITTEGTNQISSIDNPPSATGVPDPYFFVKGDKHSFLPEGGDCTGVDNCQVSSTPIQDALDAVSRGLNPDNNTIFIEGGTYTEDVTINNLSDLTLQGAADGDPSTLSGALSLTDSQNIILREFVFQEIIQVSDSVDITIRGTEGDDEIDVALEGTVDNLSVEGGGGSDSITIHQGAEDSDVIVAGGDGDDTLAIDFGGESHDHTGEVEYDGGDDFDELEVRNGQFDTTTHQAVDPSSGTMLFDSYKVKYANIEPINSTITAADVVLDFNTNAETITISDASKGQTTVDSDGSESVTFNNPTKSLIINAGDGGDVMDLQGLGTGFSASLTIDGQGGYDTFNLTDAINISGALQVNSEVININHNLTIDGTITLSAQDGVTLNGATIVNENVDASAIIIDADSDDDGIGTFSQDSNSKMDTVFYQHDGAQKRDVADGGDVTITAADVDLDGSLEAFNLKLIPSTNKVNIGFGDNIGGFTTAFNLSTAELTTNIDVKDMLSVGCADTPSANCTGVIEIRTVDLTNEDYALKLCGGPIKFLGKLSFRGGGLAIISSDTIMDDTPALEDITSERIEDCNRDDSSCQTGVYGFGLQLSSANGVGTQQQRIRVKTWWAGDKTRNTEANLSGGASTSGGFFVQNKGAVNIENDWGAFGDGSRKKKIFDNQPEDTGVFVQQGDIFIGATSPLRVSKAIRIGVGGDINLTAGNNTRPNYPSDDVEIAAVVEVCQGVQNCQGTVTVNAGQEIRGANLVSAPGVILNPCLEGGCDAGAGNLLGANRRVPGGGTVNALAALSGGSGMPGGTGIPITGPTPSVLTVTSGVPISLLNTASINGAVNLQLPGGGGATFRAGIDATVTMAAGPDVVLPDQLPEGIEALETLEIGVDTALTPEELGGILLSFGLPLDTPVEELVILQYIEGEGWVEVPFEITPEGAIEGLAETGGVFVLAQSNPVEPSPAASPEPGPAEANTGGNGSAQSPLSGNTNQPVTLEPSQGNQITVTGGAGDAVTATAEDPENLPGDLPTGSAFLNCLSVDVSQGGNGVSILPNGEGIEVSFDMPEGVAPEDVVILYWLGVLNGGQGGWQPLTPEITPDGRVIIRTFFGGTFVLANISG